MVKSINVNLTPEIKKLEVITKRVVSSQILGTYKSLFKGFGLDFEDYRVYSPNDDASMIDWRASARSPHLLVKQYMEERRLEVFLLIDSSMSMVFGSTKKLKNEFTAELAASMAHIILTAGDGLGFALFNEKEVDHKPPIVNRNNFYALTRALVNPKNYNKQFDLIKASQFLLNYPIRRNSLVIIFSDFLNMEGNWQEKLKPLTSRYDVLCFIIRDPRDEQMPDEDYMVSIEHPVSGKQMLIKPKLIKKEYNAYTRHQKEKLKKDFKDLLIDTVEFSTDKSFVEPLIGFFRRRKSRWR